MTDRIKTALDKANEEFANKEYEDYQHRAGLVKGFHWGAKWLLNNVWHKPEEKPDGDESQVYIVLTKDRYLADRDWYFAFYDLVEKWGVINGRGLRFADSEIAGWAYVEDILPEWFTETRG